MSATMQLRLFLEYFARPPQAGAAATALPLPSAAKASAAAQQAVLEETADGDDTDADVGPGDDPLAGLEDAEAAAVLSREGLRPQVVYIRGSAFPVREFWLEDVLWELGREHRTRTGRRGGEGASHGGAWERVGLEAPPAPELNPEEEAGDASRTACPLCGARQFNDWDEYAMHAATCFGPDQPGEGGVRGTAAGGVGAVPSSGDTDDAEHRPEEGSDSELDDGMARKGREQDLVQEMEGEIEGIPLEVQRHIAFFDPDSRDAPRAGGGHGEDSWGEGGPGGVGSAAGTGGGTN